ncbi:MBL fold metallo-hydrolase [Candidatus Gracilibacteria bacterium]|nr:MBL fold metallo-hydrolase [Candidatus Gracilibacteria bacterium]
MGRLTTVTPTLTRVALGYVNAYLIGHPQRWVLIDTGERTHSAALLRAARQFSADVPPQAIVLTHGHFDHAGGARELSQHWGVPVYASRFELPFLRGAEAYPQPDPAVGGFYGWLAQFVTMPTCEPLTDLHELPSDLAQIGLDGWVCVATPGHTPGHVSFSTRGIGCSWRGMPASRSISRVGWALLPAGRGFQGHRRPIRSIGRRLIAHLCSWRHWSRRGLQVVTGDRCTDDKQRRGWFGLGTSSARHNAAASLNSPHPGQCPLPGGCPAPLPNRIPLQWK